MLRAMFRLHTGTAAGIQHLTTVNHYISSTLEQQEQGGRPSCTSLMWMPRAHSSVGNASSGCLGAVGVSGFAFQGTNAHLLITR